MLCPRVLHAASFLRQSRGSEKPDASCRSANRSSTRPGRPCFLTCARTSPSEVWCETRKPYGNWRRPFDLGTLGRQIADELNQLPAQDPLQLRERIPAQGHTRSAITALRLYFVDDARGPFNA